MSPRELPVIAAEDKETLPELFARWLHPILPEGIPREKRAHCGSCPKVLDGEPADGRLSTFSPDTKCCTYLPALPNFIVGGALSGNDSGTATVQQRMLLAPTSVSPLGIAKTELYESLYTVVSNRAFGRAPLLRCPHYLATGGGTCSIWHYRNHMCTTWFCLHTTPWLGRRFWTALRELLKVIEMHVSVRCAQELIGAEWTEPTIASRLPSAESRLADELLGVSGWDTSPAWQMWKGQEMEYFAKCAKIANGLTAKEVADLIGFTGRCWMDVVSSEYARMRAGDIPARLKCSIALSRFTQHRTVMFVGPGTHEEVEVDLETVAQLERFDGRPVDEVLESLPKTSVLSKGLILRLIEVGALSPA